MVRSVNSIVEHCISNSKVSDSIPGLYITYKCINIYNAPVLLSSDVNRRVRRILEMSNLENSCRLSNRTNIYFYINELIRVSLISIIDCPIPEFNTFCALMFK